MDGDVHGVRIIPPIIEFKDTEVDVLHKINITVKNVSKSSKEIRYWHPTIKNFKLKVKNPDKPVAPGLEVPAVLEYETKEPIERKDRVVVTVDGEVVEVPIRAYPTRPNLVLEGPVDFGNVVANSKVIGKEIMLYNHGSKEGEFKLKYSGEKGISILPSSGKVPPNSVQIIRIEYVTKQPGGFDEVAKVKLEGHEISTLAIRGNVVEGGLELLACTNEERMECVKFGSTYYGTDKTESAILYNNGPEPVCFVAVLDEDAIGQEVGVEDAEGSLSGGEMNRLTSLVACIPNQGMLAPYEKVPMFFRFSPRWNEAKQGFRCSKQLPPRQDFALFMHLKVVGASSGQSHKEMASPDSQDQGSTLEVALTGTALPVLMHVSPRLDFDFGECPVGEHVDQLCKLTNDSQTLPITYQFRRVAHFTAHPPNGKIKPGQSQDVIFSYAPNQVGTFKPTQYIDMIGQVADNNNPFLMHLEIIHSVPLSFLGKSDPITVKKAPVFNPGITPKISNEVGMYVDTTVAGSKKSPRAAMLKARGTRLHHIKNDKDMANTLVAFPNDRAASIRPSNVNENYKTIFKHIPRHTYIDPDYTYDSVEAEAVRRHKQYYIDFISQLRERRRIKQQNKEHNQFEGETDLAMVPAAGLRPRKITQDEVVPDPRPPTPPNCNWALLSSKDLAGQEANSAKKLKDGLNAVPTTHLEKKECAKVLSPQELHQVIIGPPTVDFGQVCLKSVSHREIHIINNLEQHIHVNVHVDCRELRQTSPLSQVVPPKAKAFLPLIFESNNRGKFQRSLDYTINGFYHNHITVFSEVVPVHLDMSTDNLVLEPQIGLPADAGIRGVITLKNPLNHQAEFTWSPILGERGTAFSIRPATGTVEAGKDLDCEVVFHPSYLAPEDGKFLLQVHGGNSMKLNCLAQLGQTNVQFIDRRIMFGQVPLHVTTTRTAMLKNTSLNHAYFQVLDPNPFPGLSVSPIHGVVPVGGIAEIKIHLTPNAVIKFDTRVNISIRGWKTLELRMGGTVEPPVVDIDIETFNLGGVYVGSSSTTPFRLMNKAHTKAKVEFDLQRYSDFALEFPGAQTAEDHTFQLMNPGIFTVGIDPDEKLDCLLHFKPSEVASYDFVMPVSINQTNAPSPSATPFPPTPAPSNKNSINHIINPRPVHVSIATPRKKIVATALRMPLQLSHHALEFVLSPAMHEMASASGVGQSKGTVLVNNSDKQLKWSIDLTKGNEILEHGVFKFLHSSGMPYLSHGQNGVEGFLNPGETQSLGVIFCPGKAGHYEVTLPVILNDDVDHPYQHLRLTGELKSPRLWFDPLAIVLTPVPLQTEVSVDFQILASNYMRKSQVEFCPFEVELDDGSKMSPLTVEFKDSKDIMPCCGDEGHAEPHILEVKVSFKSDKPIAFSQTLTFKDDLGNEFYLPVTATADNCLLTCYPFLAQHRSDHQIVCEQGHSLKGRKTASRESMNAGEAVLVPCETPPRSQTRASTTETSSNFEVSSSSYESSSQTVTESNLPSTPREGALNKFTTESAMESRGRQDLASRSLGSALFPEEDTEEGIFHTEVLLAVQRWFSAQGWPGGPYPIAIPDTLRSGLSRKPVEEKVRTSKGDTFEANNLKKEFKTVYDMLNHLCGRQIPGIPINNPLPKDPTERCKQVYWQHSTLLTFLRNQGAAVSSIKPEYLMEPKDYKKWVAFQRDLDIKRHAGGHRTTKLKTEEEEAIEDQLFEAVSKRAWTDMLLQLLKTLVLSKVTPKQFKSLTAQYKNSSFPSVDADPLCSNIYSSGERIVLLWLNHHYEQQRAIVWRDCAKGGVPPSRWVVNFDFDLLDGLVLAAVLAAHAPFLVETHLKDMYSQPATAEQCLHNALKVVNAMRHIGIDYDIQAIDITDPNPISLILLCLHLYSNLPQYLPKNKVEFIGPLHETCVRQVRLKNPSSKPLTYSALLAGRDARDFVLPKGQTVVIPPKSQHNVTIEFTSRYLRPAEASVVFVGRRHGSGLGTTLVFTLTTTIDDITPKATIRADAPCYELHRVPLEVTNPFKESGTFRVVLVESRDEFGGAKPAATLVGGKKKKPKKIKSRIDNGRRKAESDDEDESSSPRPTLTTQPSTIRHTEGDANALSAFHTKTSSVYIDGEGTSNVDINFLPFHTGKRRCSVILVCESVGEIIYAIEAHASLPLPAQLPFVKEAGPHSVRISSAAAQGSGGGYGGDDKVVYWKCEVGQVLQENLAIPMQNQSREKALITAAQNNMSEMELERRRRTGTLTSETLTNMALEQLSSGGAAAANLRRTMSQGGRGLTFNVKCDSNNYKVPAAITIPLKAPDSPSRAGSSPGGRKKRKDECEMVEIPVQFKAKEPGHYPCMITLKAQDDIRVFKIECTVIPEGSQAEIEFNTPVHEPLTQDIPIINDTNHDWPMEASVEGMGFFGPEKMVAKAYQTTYYPLLFRPQLECTIEGKLVLLNKSDGIEHVFTLRGNGQRPLPLNTIELKCKVKQNITQTLEIPNLTKKKLFYQVESDLSCITGADNLTVLPGRTGYYDVSICPLKRGHYKGVLSFVAGANPVKDVDSDGEDVPQDEDADAMKGYRVWYSVELTVEPGPPEKNLDISCACQKKAVLEVGVTNPTDKEITITADVKGVGLTGAPSISLPPRARGVYELVYFPAIIGTFNGTLIFYSEPVGEFWYQLTLQATKPLPSSLDHMECELGRYVTQNITLTNPTDETLRLVPLLSNSNNFKLERDNEQPIEMRPHSTLQIPLTFMPSGLGTVDHRCKISFRCEQLGEMVYSVSGTGNLPQPQDPVSITAMAGSNTTLIVPFRNPLDIPVLIDVYLKDNDGQLKRVIDQNTDLTDSVQSPFCLLLRQNKALRLGPKSSIEIPISFAPEDMKMFDATLSVVVTKEDRSSWVYVCVDENGLPLSQTNSGQLHEIKWVYPLRGYPELTSNKEMKPANVTCKARNRTEERLEVTLAGVAPSTAGPKRGIKARAVTPKGKKPKTPEGIVVGETLNLADEFSYEIIYNDNDSRSELEPSLGLNLVRCYRDKSTGQVTLIFSIIYAPCKQMKQTAQLLVQASTGGLWRFPLSFTATEPDVDDTIIVEARGLNVQSAVGFKLKSNDRHPVPYTASFVAGSDPEFDVVPAKGELLPQGTLIKVTFHPMKYGKLYRGTLMVSSGDMQWTYNVRGVLPDYRPPRAFSCKPISGPHPDPRKRTNQTSYVKDNLRLATTAVSSPIKGAPLMNIPNKPQPPPMW